MKKIKLKITFFTLLYVCFSTSASALRCVMPDLEESVRTLRSSEIDFVMLVGTFKSEKPQYSNEELSKWLFTGTAYNVDGLQIRPPKKITVRQFNPDNKRVLFENQSDKYIALLETKPELILDASRCSNRLFFFNPKNQKSLETLLHEKSKNTLLKYR